MNKKLETNIKTCQLEIDSLQAQINEQQSSDSIEKMREQYEYTVEQMRDSHDHEMKQIKDHVNQLQMDLEEKNKNVVSLNEHVVSLTRNFDQASVENAEICANLTKKLNELQSKYNHDIKQLQE